MYFPSNACPEWQCRAQWEVKRLLHSHSLLLSHPRSWLPLPAGRDTQTASVTAVSLSASVQLQRPLHYWIYRAESVEEPILHSLVWQLLTVERGWLSVVQLLGRSERPGDCIPSVLTNKGGWERDGMRERERSWSLIDSPSALWPCCLSGLSSCNRSDWDGVGVWERGVGKSSCREKEGRDEKTNHWKVGIKIKGNELEARVKWESDGRKGKSSMCIWQFLLGLLRATSKWSSSNTIPRIYSKRQEVSNGNHRKTCFLRSMLLGPWCKSFWRDQRYRAALQPACCMFLWVIQWTMDWCGRCEGCRVRSERDRVKKVLQQH